MDYLIWVLDPYVIYSDCVKGHGKNKSTKIAPDFDSSSRLAKKTSSTWRSDLFISEALRSFCSFRADDFPKLRQAV